MKRKILLFILTLNFSFISFTQEKKIKYTDENFKPLTKNEFLSNPLNKNHFLYKIENDSLIINIKVERSKFGRINKATNKKIRTYLQKLSGSKVDSTQTIIINYFPSEDKCQGKGNWNFGFLSLCKDFKKGLQKKKNITQFFIFKDEKAVKNFKRKFVWYKDKSRLIEKTFFKFHYPCFSYIIIKPNGGYYSERGEYRITDILNKI